MVEALKKHWPEYLMEAACLGLFMISAFTFGAATQVGVSADFYLGSREIVRVVDLQDLSPGALAASDSLSRDFGGIGFTIGVERAIGPRAQGHRGAGRHGIDDLRRTPGNESMLAHGFDMHEEVGAEIFAMADRAADAVGAEISPAHVSFFDPDRRFPSATDP